MEISPQVVVVMAKCSRANKLFGIRIEEKQPAQWLANWSFSIVEKKAKREGYDRNVVRGTFGTDSSYPGCPHCHSPGFFQCSCGKIACWDGETRKVTCPWCNVRGKLGREINHLSAGIDR